MEMKQGLTSGILEGLDELDGISVYISVETRQNQMHKQKLLHSK